MAQAEEWAKIIRRGKVGSKIMKRHGSWATEIIPGWHITEAVESVGSKGKSRVGNKAES